MGDAKDIKITAIFETKEVWIKYRWEFMRRDPEFIREFDKLSDSYAHYKEGDLSEEEFYNAAREYGNAFDIAVPVKGPFLGPPWLDRHKSYEEMKQEYGKNSLAMQIFDAFIGNTVRIIRDSNNSKSHLLRNTVCAIDGLSVPDDHLVIDIDFSQVNQIHKLKELVSLCINEEWKAFRKKHPGLHEKINESDFEVILKVGDIKEGEKGITWTELGNRIYGPYDSDKNNRADKAEQRYNRYEYLIRGGWRKFRFP